MTSKSSHRSKQSLGRKKKKIKPFIPKIELSEATPKINSKNKKLRRKKKKSPMKIVKKSNI